MSIYSDDHCPNPFFSGVYKDPINFFRLFLGGDFQCNMNPLVKIILFLPAILQLANGEFCLPMLKTVGEAESAMILPGRIRKWDPYTKEFVLLEALKKDGELFCSVDFLSRADLQGRTIVVAVHSSPYVRVQGNYTGVSGYLGDIWMNLEETLKFKSIFTKPGPTNRKTLTNGTIDVLLEANAIATYTAGHYTYSYQVITNSYALFALSEGTRVSLWWYAKIFSRGLWAMTSLFLIGITCMLVGMYRIKKATCHDYIECNDELDAVSLDLLCVLGGITGQGFQMMPSSLSLRIVMITSLVMGLLISSGFSGNLTSYLASRGSFAPLQSLHDVAQKRTHSLCMRTNSLIYNDLMQSVLGTGLALKGLINTGNCPQDMRGIKDLCKSDVIYMEVPDIFIDAYRQSQQSCKIIQLPGDYWGLRISFLFARFSPYRQVINTYLMKLHSSGVFDYLERKWISRELLDEVHQKFDFQAVEHGHIIIIFLGLCSMILISALICIIEVIWYRIRLRCDREQKIKRRMKMLNKLADGHFPRKSYPRIFPE
ncbi:uncharacterized protein [Fopius arisanus]|uniref:Ionotropic glutamate receptor C-terminal domain-containing protein n=1 Tax=Fopius arisanus TaxID=64838 RepID=A0A9R1T1Y3_9HYME|nr:PREDICTED: uncharacterized protein LOC105265690 [Fopius arisanus]